MELVTSRFGGIRFDAAEVIVMAQGIFSHPKERQWLLVADKVHPLLNWLQCISNSRVAIPVVSAADVKPDYRVTIEPDVLADLKVADRQQVLALAPVFCGVDRLSIALDMPILISAESAKGRQLQNDQYQPIQRLMSESTAALPECA